MRQTTQQVWTAEKGVASLRLVYAVSADKGELLEEEPERVNIWF